MWGGVGGVRCCGVGWRGLIRCVGGCNVRNTYHSTLIILTYVSCIFVRTHTHACTDTHTHARTHTVTSSHPCAVEGLGPVALLPLSCGSHPTASLKCVSLPNTPHRQESCVCRGPGVFTGGHWGLLWHNGHGAGPRTGAKGRQGSGRLVTSLHDHDMVLTGCEQSSIDD